MAYQQYSDSDWESMRPVIEDLYYSAKKTYKDTADILNTHYGFRVKSTWIQYKVTKTWRGGRNFTKKRTMQHLELDAYEIPALDMSSGTRIMRTAIRYGIDVPASHLHSFKLTYDRYITPPALYASKDAVMHAVRKYVDGAFDNHIWTIETFSDRITQDFLRWTCDDPPSVFKILGYLTCATVCAKQKMHQEAQLLLRYGLAELPAYFNDQSPEALLVFIVLLDFFRDRMPTERDKLLRHCINGTQPVGKARPLREILYHIDAAEQQSADADFRTSLLHDVATMFNNKLKGKLKDDKLGYAVIQPLHRTGELEDFNSLTWDDPNLVQRNDKTFFSSSSNIERYIVLAVERFGYRELLQIEEMLRRQRSLAETSGIRGMIDRHLASLQRPIQRIGFRDNHDDMRKFKKHWKQTTAGWEMTLVPQGPNHIVDMLQGMERFKHWEDQDEVSSIKKHLYTVFLQIAADLGEQDSYEMTQDGVLHSAWHESQRDSL